MELLSHPNRTQSSYPQANLAHNYKRTPASHPPTLHPMILNLKAKTSLNPKNHKHVLFELAEPLENESSTPHMDYFKLIVVMKQVTSIRGHL